jgi:DNA-binding FrmR family transcriptional regulator
MAEVPTPGLSLYDESTRSSLHDRLGKVEGQLRGVGRMIDGQRPAEEVLQQLASIRSAVKGITKAVMRSYIEVCAADAVKSGDPDAIDAMLETLIKFVKE